MRHHDLIIVGAGSGNMLLTPDFDDWDVAIVEEGAFGGTCLNRGCIPSKMYVYAAELAHMARSGPSFGVQTTFEGADWPAIRDRVFGRIDPIATAGKAYRESLDGVTVYPVHARFVGHKILEVGGEQISARHIVLAAGARVALPPIPGLSSVPFHTSDDIMRLEHLPERLVIIGGGFIGAELGDVFGALGSDVEYLIRGPRMLRDEDDDISTRITDIYRDRYTVRTGTSIERVEQTSGGILVTGTHEGRPFTTEGDVLLVAAGRVPNGDDLGVVATGVDVDDDGYVRVDALGRTRVDGIWAVGDIAYREQLKHVANATTRAVAHNIANPDDPITVDLGAVPHAVFSHPQIASVGATERELMASSTPYTKVVQPYGAAAYGWALEDDTSVAKLLAHAETRQLLGAHIMGPLAGTLIQQLIQGMRFGQTVDEMAKLQYYIHPAPPEIIEQALLEL